MHCHVNNFDVMKISLYSVLVSLVFCCVQSLDNGLGRTPQMGWNSWNHYHCTVNQKVIEQTADAFIATGLDKLGYKYVNVDDCWAKTRLATGVVVPDPLSFPDFQAMIDYVHSKGLLFGLYSDAGKLTCARRPGSLSYETVDANTYASWKVDYLKYDNCNSENKSPETRYPIMRDTLNKTGRPIFYSMCEWGVDNPALWAPKVGNSWRTTGDIGDSWNSMISRADQNNKWWKYAGPGGWNDPDMLEVGNGGMTTTEYETHFSLWALMKAPLLIGCDVNNMDNETVQILSNTEVIAINQDALGVQGKKVLSNDNKTEVWAGPLMDGAYTVILLNRADNATNIAANWSTIGLDPSTKVMVRDLWKGMNLGSMVGSIQSNVPSHGVAMYKLTPM